MESNRVLYFAYDPQFAGQMAENLEDIGFVPVKMPQRQWAFNEPMIEMYSAIAEGRFIIDERDHVLLWAFSNMTINRDTVGRMMPDKGKSKDKIDPAVAVIMALKACLASPEKFTGSLFLS
jgi:phage terminase large subunit-like protein